jgi:hypothetical protein
MGTARCMGMEEMVIPTPTEARTPAPPAIGGTNATAALYRLMTWLSPQFPVGSYTYSHGIEHPGAWRRPVGRDLVPARPCGCVGGRWHAAGRDR